MIPAHHIRIRQAYQVDRHNIVEINRKAWEAAYTHMFTPHQIDALFTGRVKQQASWLHWRTRRICTLVAEVNRCMVGFITLGGLKTPHVGEVTSLYVKPDYQGQGIGGKLWEAGIEALKIRGCSALWVWVLAQAPAVGFYEARGCIRREQGTYTVADHTEAAYGYYLSWDE